MSGAGGSGGPFGGLGFVLSRAGCVKKPTVPYRTLPYLAWLGRSGRISVNPSWALLTSLGLTLPHRFRCSEQV
jgi:hypothetical protein